MYLNTESCGSAKHLSAFVRVCLSVLNQKFLERDSTIDFDYFCFLGKSCMKLGVPLTFLSFKTLFFFNGDIGNTIPLM